MMSAALITHSPRDDHYTINDNQDLVLGGMEEFFSAHHDVSISEPILLTLLITDIVGSTQKLAVLGDHHWSELLDQHDEIVRRQVSGFGGRIINTTGDGFITAFAGPTRAIQCAEKIQVQVAQLDMEIRAGIHIGECERRGADISGLTVHIASRILGCASAGQILTSGTVKDITVGSELVLRHVGTPRLKGVPGDWPLYEVRS